MNVFQLHCMCVSICSEVCLFLYQDEHGQIKHLMVTLFHIP